ncbi:PepSY-associated TM helix domain-containing protein [Mucilaginibacter koreensis]
MTVRSSFLFVHRWLGFVSGLVVFIVSVTGCIFCFQDEIQDAMYEWRHVQPQQQAYLPPSIIKQKGLAQYPGATASYTYYYGKDRPAMLYASMPNKELNLIYLNPYTGQVLHTQNTATDFFTIIKYIHLYLLLPANVGSMVVGVSVVIFVILLITGMILWWPKRKSDRKRSFTIKWKGKWRRVNYDLHNVLGFYACGIALVLAITGLAIAFQWVNKGMYLAANGGKDYPAERVIPTSDSTQKAIKQLQPAINEAFSAAQRMAPYAQMYLFSENTAANGSIGVTAYPNSLRFDHNSYYYFDQYSGKLLSAVPYAKKSAGQKLIEMNYDIHVGQIFGITGKIIAFLVSFICASLPLTGIIIWLGKRKKPKTQKVKHVVQRREKAMEGKPKFMPRTAVLNKGAN